MTRTMTSSMTAGWLEPGLWIMQELLPPSITHYYSTSQSTRSHIMLNPPSTVAPDIESLPPHCWTSLPTIVQNPSGCNMNDNQRPLCYTQERDIDFMIVERSLREYLHASLCRGFFEAISKIAPLSAVLALLSIVCFTEAYDLEAKYDASNFFKPSSFKFYEGYDEPTHGLANYVSKDEATRLGLAQNSTGKVYLGVDSSTVLSSPASGPDKGRKSIRLEGIETIDNGLVIVDLDHLPAGTCGQ